MLKPPHNRTRDEPLDSWRFRNHIPPLKKNTRKANETDAHFSVLMEKRAFYFLETSDI